LGLTPQFMMISIPRTEVLIENGTMTQTIEGGFTFGWGGELQLGMKVREDLTIDLRSRVSSDLSMLYIIPSAGVKYFY